MLGPEWSILPAFVDPARAREHMPVVLQAFGPNREIADWASPGPDQPLPNKRVARYIERRIYIAGEVYQTMKRMPSVAETREGLQGLKPRLIAIHRAMRQQSHLREVFNAADGREEERNARALAGEERIGRKFMAESVEDSVEQDAWQHALDTIQDAVERFAFSTGPDANLAERLGQPPTRRKRPERVLWEAILKLLSECGISPMDKYQPLIETIRAVHRLFGIDPPDEHDERHLYYTVHEFQKQRPAGD